MNPTILPFSSATEFTFGFTYDNSNPDNSCMTLSQNGNIVASITVGNEQWMTICCQVDGSGKLALGVEIVGGVPAAGSGSWNIRSQAPNFACKIRNTMQGNNPYTALVGAGDCRTGVGALMTNMDVIFNIINPVGSTTNNVMLRLDYQNKMYFLSAAYPTANYNACSGSTPYFPTGSCCTPSIPASGKWYNP
jgi:hypothetical protein